MVLNECWYLLENLFWGHLLRLYDWEGMKLNFVDMFALLNFDAINSDAGMSVDFTVAYVYNLFF